MVFARHRVGNKGSTIGVENKYGGYDAGGGLSLSPSADRCCGSTECSEQAVSGFYLHMERGGYTMTSYITYEDAERLSEWLAKSVPKRFPNALALRAQRTDGKRW